MVDGRTRFGCGRVEVTVLEEVRVRDKINKPELESTAT
jgi:hypothetical protein